MQLKYCQCGENYQTICLYISQPTTALLLKSMLYKHTMNCFSHEQLRYTLQTSTPSINTKIIKISQLILIEKKRNLLLTVVQNYVCLPSLMTSWGSMWHSCRISGPSVLIFNFLLTPFSVTFSDLTLTLLLTPFSVTFLDLTLTFSLTPFSVASSARGSRTDLAETKGGIPALKKETARYWILLEY